MLTWVLVACVVVAAWLYSRWRHGYWARHNIPTAPGCVPFFGHIFTLMSIKEPRWDTVDDWYKNHGGSTFCGSYDFLKPTITIGDPDLVKAICIKDFDHFVDRRTMKFEHHKDIIGNEMLTNLSGNHWKSTRAVLSTSFSSGRLKELYPLVMTKADQLIEYIKKQQQTDPVTPIKKVLGNFTMEVIASCAFGVETNCFGDEEAIFTKKANTFFTLSLAAILKFMFLVPYPKLGLWFNIRASSEHQDFFEEVVNETIRQRKINGRRGDFLDIMMDTKKDLTQNGKKPVYPFRDETITATCILFFIAGYDTTANTMSFTAAFLATHPEAQDKLRAEMQAIIAEHGSLTYQAIMEAKYLDACVSEALRILPAAPVLERRCTKDFQIPGTDYVIPEGMITAIPVWSLHHDERYWPNPLEFDPERFMPENKDSIVNGTYLPFGLGPRHCIAMRFAQMEAKLGLAKLITEFKLEAPPGYEKVELDTTNKLIPRLRDDGPLILTPLSKLSG